MKKTLIISTIVVFFVAVILYFVLRQKAGTGTTITGEADTTSNPNANNLLEVYTSLPDAAFPLVSSLPYGSYGRQVMLVQAYINRNLGGKLTLDGKFGPKTLAAVKENFFDIETKKSINEITKAFFDIYITPLEAILRDYLLAIKK